MKYCCDHREGYKKNKELNWYVIVLRKFIGSELGILVQTKDHLLVVTL